MFPNISVPHLSPWFVGTVQTDSRALQGTFVLLGKAWVE